MNKIIPVNSRGPSLDVLMGFVRHSNTQTYACWNVWLLLGIPKPDISVGRVMVGFAAQGSQD